MGHSEKDQNMCVWSPQKEELENGGKKTTEEIVAANFVNWWKASSHRFKGILNSIKEKHKEKHTKIHYSKIAKIKEPLRKQQDWHLTSSRKIMEIRKQCN